MSLTVLSNTDMRSDCAVCAIFRNAKRMSAKKKKVELSQTYSRSISCTLDSLRLGLALTKIFFGRTYSNLD